MSRNLTPKQSQGLAIGLLILAILAAYLSVVRPYRQAYVGYQEQLASLQERLARYRALAASREAVLEQLKQLGDSPQLKEYFFSEPTTALASADLQQHVKQAIVSSGGRLVSTQVLEIRSQEGAVPVTVKVSMRGPIEAVQQLFHTLEASQRLLFVDSVTLRQQSRRRRRIARRPNQAVIVAGPELGIEFELTAYARLTAS